MTNRETYNVHKLLTMKEEQREKKLNINRNVFPFVLWKTSRLKAKEKYIISIMNHETFNVHKLKLLIIKGSSTGKKWKKLNSESSEHFFWNRLLFQVVTWGFYRSNTFEQSKWQLKQIIGVWKFTEKK